MIRGAEGLISPSWLSLPFHSTVPAFSCCSDTPHSIHHCCCSRYQDVQVVPRAPKAAPESNSAFSQTLFYNNSDTSKYMQQSFHNLFMHGVYRLGLWLIYSCAHSFLALFSPPPNPLPPGPFLPLGALPSCIPHSLPPSSPYLPFPSPHTTSPFLSESPPSPSTRLRLTYLFPHSYYAMYCLLNKTTQQQLKCHANIHITSHAICVGDLVTFIGIHC